MGVLKTPSATKIMNIHPDVIIPLQPSCPSPAVSSISSDGSGAYLINGNQLKAPQKRKTLSLTVAKKQVSAKLMNILWTGLFLMVIVATVIVVATLAENIRKNSWTRGSVSIQDEEPSLPPVTNPLEGFYTKIGPGTTNACTHRRFLWERWSQSSEIIHDLRSQWSAVVNHNIERCLLFDLHNVCSQNNDCPVMYPRELDLHVGIPSCTGPLAKIAPIRKIMHLICNSTQVNLTNTGETISKACSEYRVIKVDKVIIQYFDRDFRRVARRSTDSIKNSDVFVKSPHGDYKGLNMDKASMLPAESNGPLNKIVPTDVSDYSSPTGNPNTPAVLVKQTDEISPPNSRTRNHAISSTSERLGNEGTVSIDPSQIPKKYGKLTVSTTKNTDFENVENEATKSKLITILTDGLKKELQEQQEPEAGDSVPASDTYWEVTYNSVVGANKVFEAGTFQELALMSMAASKADLDKPSPA